MNKLQVRVKMAGLLIALCAGGCVTENLVSPAPQAPALTSSTWNVPPAAASRATANKSPEYQRVEQLGQRLLDASPELALKPIFLVVETPELEIFHQGTSRLVITRGLVDQCQTDGQLAALLSLEFAKMAAERDMRGQLWDAQGTVVASSRLSAGGEPPPEVRIGPDGGSFGEADQIRKAELAKLGYDRRKATAPRIAYPDTTPVARQCLANADFHAGELDAIGPMLRQAARNNALEKQFNGQQ